MDESIKLFSDNGKVPELPSIDENQHINEDGKIENKNSIHNGANLISHGVEEALKGDVVKSILIPEALDLTLPNYLIDFRNISKIRRHQVIALDDMLSDDGDTAIYVFLKNGMTKLGMSDSSRIDDIILAGVKSIFGKDCLLFQNVERGKPLRELKQKDVNKIRLRI